MLCSFTANCGKNCGLKNGYVQFFFLKKNEHVGMVSKFSENYGSRTKQEKSCDLYI